MTRRITAVLSLLLLTLALSTPAFAKKKARIIDTARSVPMSLSEAIDSVEDRLNGRVFEIELTRKKKRDLYAMWVVVDIRVYEVLIDAQDGKLVQQNLKGKKPVRLGKSLDEIVEIALKKQPGVAYKAVCKKKKARCEVGVATSSDDLYELTINGNTGDVQSIELQ